MVGDVSGAACLLSSGTTLAPFTPETVEALCTKHPSQPSDLECPAASDDSQKFMLVSSTDIEKAVRSFNPESAAGPDKISPQHLKELISRQTGEAGVRLLQSPTSLANMMLAGDIPHYVLPFLYGANLIALNKPAGGVRPIAVGNTIRRMVAKTITSSLGEEIGRKLRPTQLGFGTPGGCEAAVHASRRFLASAEVDKKTLLKLDYRNAFNIFASFQCRY